MEKRGIIFAIALGLTLISCQPGNKGNKGLGFSDDAFHFVLYTFPSSDCLDCILTALQVLSKNAGSGKEIYILAEKSVDLRDFKKFLANKYSRIKYFLLDSNLNIPHPSILLVKNNVIYMYIYLPNDPFLLEETINRSIKLLAEIGIGERANFFN